MGSTIDRQRLLFKKPLVMSSSGTYVIEGYSNVDGTFKYLLGKRGGEWCNINELAHLCAVETGGGGALTNQCELSIAANELVATLVIPESAMLPQPVKTVTYRKKLDS